jgi:hypothetical protein
MVGLCRGKIERTDLGAGNEDSAHGRGLSGHRRWSATGASLSSAASLFTSARLSASHDQP